MDDFKIKIAMQLGVMKIKSSKAIEASLQKLLSGVREKHVIAAVDAIFASTNYYQEFLDIISPQGKALKRKKN